MKYFVIILLIINISCTPQNNKVVETYKETQDCLIGEWIPENSNQVPYTTYTFSAEYKEDKLQNRIFIINSIDKTGRIINEKGNWNVKSVGKIRAILGGVGAWGIDLEFTNCSRLVARGRNIYIKKSSIITKDKIKSKSNDEQISLSKEEKWVKYTETFLKALISKDKSTLISLVLNQIKGEGLSNEEWVDRVILNSNYLEKLKQTFEIAPTESSNNNRIICNEGLCLYFDYIDNRWLLVDVFED